MSTFTEALQKAKDVFKDMILLVRMCEENTNDSIDLWNTYWDSFWTLSGEFPFNVNWCDLDTTYEADIMARYNAISDFMDTIKDYGE